MPQTTALHRVSTLVVGALFAVVFVCSGASATHGVVTQGESAVGAHTASSKAAVRAIEHATAVDKAPSHSPLAATGPSVVDHSPAFTTDLPDGHVTPHRSTTLFTTSERAPPAL